MSWLTSLFVAALSGVLGLVVAGLVTATLSQWLEVSSREGAAGYLMIFVALIGGAVGFALGLGSSRIAPGMPEPGFLKALGISGGAVLDLPTRFNFWKQAWWTIHQRLGVDGRPPVQAIYDLATARARGRAMEEIEVNARVFFEALTKKTEEKKP